jgi:hypothetical protein
MPIEEVIVTFSRALCLSTFVVNFRLIAAMNPWACSTV